MRESYNIINPSEIRKEDLPYVVLSDSLRSLFGLLIKQHTEGSYSHAMLMVEPGVFASQGFLLKNEPVEKYMKCRLKFWKPQLTDDEKEILRKAVSIKLSLPWHKRIYDIPGIIGQGINLPDFNIPGLNYCSEFVDEMLTCTGFDYGQHNTPTSLNTKFKDNPEIWKVAGYWFSD